MKQRWYVRNGNIVLAMGNDAINVTPKTGGDYPVLGLASPFMRSPFNSYNGEESPKTG